MFREYLLRHAGRRPLAALAIALLALTGGVVAEHPAVAAEVTVGADGSMVPAVELDRAAPVIEMDEPCRADPLYPGDVCSIAVGAAAFGPYMTIWQRSATADFASPETITGPVSTIDNGAGWVETYLTLTGDEPGVTFYRVIIGNGVQPDAVSSVHQVTVVSADVAPWVMSQPENAEASVGGEATFTAAGWGSPAPNAQWESSRDGYTWHPISEGVVSTVDAQVATSTLTVPGVTVEHDEMLYRAVFTNVAGAAVTDAVTLSIRAVVLQGSEPRVAGVPRVGALVVAVPGAWTPGATLA